MAGKKTHSDYHGHSGYRRGSEPSDNLFGWTIFIFFLIGLVFLCWMGSYYIFARPEKAANYNLLQRLHKIEPPQRFEITAAPRGEFLKPGQLLEHFGSMTIGEIHRSNETLLRSFIRNYHQNRELVPYAVGTYRIIGTLPLSNTTFCNSGFVALLQAIEQPEILLEQLFTANEKNLPVLKRSLSIGQQIKLEKPLDLSAVIHITRLPDNRLLLTTMPLLYGNYGSGQGSASFSLEPPEKLNLTTSVPVLTDSQIEQLSSNPLAEVQGNKSSTHLTQIRETVHPATPEPRIAKALPVLPQESSETSNQPTTHEPMVARALPVHEPAVLPAIPVATPLQTPTPAPLIPKPLPAATLLPTPSVVASPTPPEIKEQKPASIPLADLAAPPAFPTNASHSPSSSEPWPVYAPGQMPRGQLVEASQTVEIATRSLDHDRHYLQGRFSVTASGNGKAVLRPQSALVGVPLMGPSAKVRVIVEFPAGALPPPEGNTISRDSRRPFLITSIKRSDDGQINVYVREVTKSE